MLSIGLNFAYIKMGIMLVNLNFQVHSAFFLYTERYSDHLFTSVYFGLIFKPLKFQASSNFSTHELYQVAKNGNAQTP